MEFLRFLEGIRTGIGDAFFSAITYIGDEIFFLVFAILFFWCINKRQGYYILVTGVVGSVINQWLKIACRIPRPWIIDPGFKPVESAVERATGYSFPSGHTQNVTGTFGCIARYNRKKWLRITCIVIIALVSFSRMYLGVHTPKDVLVSLGVATVLVFLFYEVFKTEERQRRFMDILVVASVALSIGFILYAFLIPEASFTTEADIAALGSARKNASTLIGCLAALVIVYPLDKFVIKFETDARWYSQAIKLIIGVGIDLVIKELLKDPLVAVFGNEYLARGIRYFLIVVFSGAVWPLTFKFFKNLRIPVMERFTEWLVGKFNKKESSNESV